jgi:hypothetical protein
MARSGAGFAGETVPVALLRLVFKNIARDRSSGKSGGSSVKETIKHTFDRVQARVQEYSKRQMFKKHFDVGCGFWEDQLALLRHGEAGAHCSRARRHPRARMIVP